MSIYSELQELQSSNSQDLSTLHKADEILHKLVSQIQEKVKLSKEQLRETFADEDIWQRYEYNVNDIERLHKEKQYYSKEQVETLH